MSTIDWARRVAITGCAGLGLAVAGAGIAAAQGGPADTPTGPAPITISSGEVAQLCQDRIPPLKAEVTKLINWINAGPTQPGSTAWLHAQAQQAQSGHHPALADILNGRAERRTGVLTILRNVQTKIDQFDAAHCAYLGNGS